MDFTNSQISEYCEENTTAPGQVLDELERETWLKVLMPNMLSGHLQGRFLSMISGMIRPMRILEIGTFTGYSTICLAEGLTDKGRITTIDINEELEDLVRNYLEKAGINEQVDLIIGNALEVIPGLDPGFDLAFIDADKENYSSYYELVMEKLRPGGYMIADNVLWSGKVLKPGKNSDKETSGLVEFNKKVQNDPNVENLMLPIRDGLTLIRKRL